MEIAGKLKKSKKSQAILLNYNSLYRTVSISAV